MCVFHRWGLGFRQCSFRPITRVLQDDTFSVFQCPPLFRHAPFPSSFRFQVNRMPQEQPSGLLLTESGIQHRVPRRTFSMHTAQAWNNAPARYERVQFHWPTTPLTGRGCPGGATWSLLRQCRLPPWVSTVARAAPAGSGQFRRQICFAPYVGWLSVHDHPHPREVSSLSRGVISQPLFDLLRADFRFLPRPLPAASSVRLTAGLPVGEDYGLTTLHPGNLRGLGPASTPVARHLRRMSKEHPDLATHHFGPSLSAPLARLQ